MGRKASGKRAKKSTEGNPDPLNRRERRLKNRKGPAREAAVLVPVYRGEEGDLWVVLVRRSESGIHGGQLAFPGGKHDAEDPSMLDTALREAQEEIGIGTEMIEVLEHLPVVETITTGFRVYPFLARVVRPEAWQRQKREIAEIVEVRLRDLVHPNAQGEDVEQSANSRETRRFPFYRVGSYKLWGVTYRILHPLISRLLAGEWAL